MKTANRKTVYVGMSGGVDSSVSAHLLKNQGFNVVGVFIKTWQPDFISCTWKEERRDAMRVTAKLGIPFLTLDCEKEYRDLVAYYMIDEYRAGRTPNPDVMCNKEIKFGAFFNWAMKSGADYVATGHYARVIFDKDGRYRLGKGLDLNKDQSYFLWQLKREQLEHILFPVGEMTKDAVRSYAKKHNLSTAEKKDSQGVCFLGEIDMKEFLSHYMDAKEGNVLNQDGEVIGSHDGAFFYTIGERHGFTITKRITDEEPFFVIKKDIENNTITVAKRKDFSGSKNKEDLVIELRDVNWISTGFPELGKTYEGRIRYRGELLPFNFLQIKGDIAVLSFEKKPFAISKGQSLVLYDGDICIGGGIIK